LGLRADKSTNRLGITATRFEPEPPVSTPRGPGHMGGPRTSPVYSSEAQRKSTVAPIPSRLRTACNLPHFSNQFAAFRAGILRRYVHQKLIRRQYNNERERPIGKKQQGSREPPPVHVGPRRNDSKKKADDCQRRLHRISGFPFGEECGSSSPRRAGCSATLI
jgi:hypothetical protein